MGSSVEAAAIASDATAPFEGIRLAEIQGSLRPAGVFASLVDTSGKQTLRRIVPRYENPVGAGSVSLIIPAYNEATRLPKTLERYVPALERMGIPFEIIVISDGQDETAQLARQYSGRGVKCYEFGHKLGRGGAIFEGLRRARNSVIAYTDADGSVPPDDLLLLLGLCLSGNPAVIASRRLDPEVVVVPERPFRLFIGTAWRILFRLLLNLRVQDAQCGMKAFNREVVDRIILPKVQVTNRTFEVGMLFHIQSSGIPLTEVPVRYVHDFDTRMPITRAVPIMFLTLIGIFLVNVVMRADHPVPRLMVDLNRRFSSV